jgi:S1-C subfamily serine protease
MDTVMAGTRSTFIAVALAMLAPMLAPEVHAQSVGRRAVGSQDSTTTIVQLRAVQARERAEVAALIDSLLHRFNGEPLASRERELLRQQIDALVFSLERAARAQSLAGGRIGIAMDSAYAERLRAERQQARIKLMQAPGEVPVLRGWLGITAQGPQFTPSVQGRDVILRYVSHPEIVSVEPNSPAQKAGIQRGDRLIAYDGRDVRQPTNVSALLQPSRRVRVTVERDGDRRDFTLTVAPAPRHLMERRVEFGLLEPVEPAAVAAAPLPPDGPGAPTPNAIVIAPRAPSGLGAGRVFIMSAGDAILGAPVAPVDRDLGSHFGVSSGVLMVRVAESSPAYALGLRTGDVIVKAQGDAVTSVAQLQRVLARSQRDGVEVELVRKRRAVRLRLAW